MTADRQATSGVEDWERDALDRGAAAGRPVRHAARRPGRPACPASATPCSTRCRRPRSRRTALTLLNLNQAKGIDCPGCAWPEPDRSTGTRTSTARTASSTSPTRRPTRGSPAEFFAEHSGRRARREVRLLAQPAGTADRADGQACRAATHYEPISWDDAIGLLADELNGLDSPDEAMFYTSGRLNNEGAFLLQLFARAFGTNNLPDCSNMCHESSGSALGETLGVGKGTVSLDDIYEADLVLVVGQNPGTNHPRMLTALEQTKHNGGSGGRGQPAARGRAQAVQEPAEAERRRRAGHDDRRPVPPDPARRRPGAVPDAQPAAARGRGRRTRHRAGPGLHRARHHRLRGVRASTSGRPSGTTCSRRPA